MERRLAAILVAEVSDYSRSVGENEAGAQSTRKVSLRNVIDPKVTEHDGRVLKGVDGFFVAEFVNVVEAVKCGVAVQRLLAEWNAAIPEAERLEVRIGINLCDIVVEGDDILGSGISIAARLGMTVAPGGICISGTAFDQVEAKLNLSFEFLGQHQLRHLSEPIRAYRVLT